MMNDHHERRSHPGPRTVVVFDGQFALQRFGGISRYFYELATRLSAADAYEAHVVAPLYLNDYLRDASFRVWGKHIVPPRSRGLIPRGVGALNRAVFPTACRLLQAELVHETYFRSGPRAADVPTVTTVYDMIHEKFPDMFPSADHTSRLKRESVERADLVACISEQTRRDLIEYFGVPERKTRVTYLASSMRSSTEPRPAPPGKPFLLYIGNRAGYKNFTSLLRAYAQLGSLRDGLRIVLYGGPAISAQERDLMRTLGLAEADVSHLIGGDDKLAELYEHALALVYPSLYEGFGIPPLEAMSLGCPVICPPVGSLPEVVGDAAAFFNPNQVEELTNRIRELVEDRTLRDALIAKGRQRASLFSWNRCATETIRIYRELAS